MQLLDRYLQSVANFLPAKNREDVLAELRANLIAQFESREEATGRPITEDEEADILRKHGPPMVVASRYFPQQHLIGPAWIATYWFVLKIGLAVSAAVTLIVSLMFVALDKISAGELFAMWFRYPATALTVFAWTTLVFATSEYFAKRFNWKAGLSEFRWDPRKLPVIRLNGETAGGSPRSDFFGACVGLLVIVAMGNWLNLTPLAAHHGVSFTPAWRTLYDVLIATAVVTVVTAFTRMLRPDWGFVKPASGSATSLIVLGALLNFLRYAPWLVPGGAVQPDIDLANLNMILRLMVRAWMVALIVIIAFYAWNLAKQLRQRNPRTGISPAIV
jgi:hypothetical protein